jgi:hypothetical protein
MTMPAKKWTKKDARELQALTRKIIKADGGDHNIRAMAAEIERRHERLAPDAAQAFADPRSYENYREIVQQMASSRAGRPNVARVVIITGPRASGKTHLAQQLMRLLGQDEKLLLPMPESPTLLNDDLAEVMKRGGARVYDNVHLIRRLVGYELYNIMGGISAVHKGEKLDARIWVIITASEFFNSPAVGVMAGATIISLKERAGR